MKLIVTIIMLMLGACAQYPSEPQPDKPVLYPSGCGI